MLTKIEWEVLNAVADDMENLEQIYRIVFLEYFDESRGGISGSAAGCWRAREPLITLSDAADALLMLTNRGCLVPVMDENGNPWTKGDDATMVWRAWFRMTDTGMRATQTRMHSTE